LPRNDAGELAVNIKINDLHEPDVQPIAESDLPVLEVSKEKDEARNLLLADGSLVSVKNEMACENCGQLLMPPMKKQLHVSNELPQKQEDAAQKPQTGVSADIAEERYKEIKDKVNSFEGMADSEEFLQAAKAPEVEKEPLESSSSSINAVFLLKVMTLLVVMLLAIEAIIYFI
jgi:hypothetical protein